MKHISKSKNKKISKRVKRRNEVKRSISNTQSGGVKVIIGMGSPGPDKKPIERQVTTIEHFAQIVNTARNLEVISNSSLNSFVIKVHLADDREFLKSDIESQDGKKLDFLEIMDATSGKVITELIIKICILGRSANPKDYVFNGKKIEKRGVDLAEFSNEYETQRYLYSAMMSSSGNPFCPDAFGILQLQSEENIKTVFDAIMGYIHSSNEVHTILTYMIDLIKGRHHHMGLIMMDSVPGHYDLLTAFLPQQRRYNQKSFEELSEIICAINILTIYRGKIFLLDAHPNNWLCDPSLPTLSKVKAIDFGRVYRIHSEESVSRFLTSVKDNVGKYFARISCVTPKTVGTTMADFFIMLGLSRDAHAQLIHRLPLFQSQVTEASKMLVESLRELIDIFKSDAFFSKPFSELTTEERERSINMIHRLLLSLSLVDGFFNDTKFGDDEVRRSQQYESYKQLYETNLSTPDLIIGSQMLMDFRAMTGGKKHGPLSKIYEKIYNIVHNYCKDRFFPDIRGYSAFKKVERSISRQAVIKLTPHTRVAGSKIWDACKVVGDSLGRFGMETGPFLERRVMNPIFDKLVYNPTMWVAYKLKLLKTPAPPPRVFAKSAGGGGVRRRGSKRKHTRKHKRANK
jgi:hypothetical protein